MTIIELFKKLLRFKSITPDDDGAFDFITNYLGSDWECLELDIKDVKNRYYTKKFNNTNQQLCFAGHIDVVPAGEGWNSDPFEPQEKDGIIIGRGAQDMKSGVAAFLYACKSAQDFDGTLSILLTSDEEADAICGTVKVLEYLKSKNLLPNYAVVAEPTCENIFGDFIKVGRRGSINGYLTIQGKQGHAAYPEKTINPVDQISKVLPKISGHKLDDGDEFFAPSQLIITDIRAGMEVTNVTPDKLRLMFNVRNSTKTIQGDIKNFIDEACDGLDYTFKMTQGSYPFMTNEDSKIVSNIVKSIKDIINITTKKSTAGGTSDARFFGQFGVDTVEFGVINDTIHSINEKTAIREVKQLTHIFEKLIKDF
ncbi:N-succinyl-L,L-diaminopimelate desuccinylase [hydrothermal vent metagenome]|uniref:Succinyl-diaminopimelate desuccinylase n=1 Tax=hydrothermal vent metagenome TaxID=652676 RepID=A0A3B1E5G3_9ZZZZ